MTQTNFVEAKNVEEANAIDLTKYTLVGVNTDRGVYYFKIREQKR